MSVGGDHNHAPDQRATTRTEAADWLVRLQRSDRDVEMEDAFRRWLDSDPSHRRAFDQATTVWEALGGVEPSPRALGRRRQIQHLRPVLAVAAVAAVLVFVLGLEEALAPERAFDTAIGQQRTVTMADGSRISLNTDSKVRVAYSLLGRRVRIDRGEAMFEVAKNPSRPFVVHADGRRVRALGTTFIVRTGQQNAAVTLIEGKVSIARDEAFGGAVEATLTSGQHWSLAGRRVTRLTASDLEAASAWRRQEAIFDNTSLPDAVAEMNRYSGIRIVVVGPAADLRLSGVFQVGESQSFARTVSRLYGLELRTDGREIRLSPPSI